MESTTEPASIDNLVEQQRQIISLMQQRMIVSLTTGGDFCDENVINLREQCDTLETLTAVQYRGIDSVKSKSEVEQDVLAALQKLKR